MAAFAYLFERFPSFTQTFCYREVAEIRRRGLNVPVYSIRRPADIPGDCPESVKSDVLYLPEPAELGQQMKSLKMLGKYPWPVIRQIRTWGKRPDKARLLEAAWLGPKLREQGVRHIHAHFAGIAARTAWWINKFYGIPFSFTGHANDMFCESGFPVTLDDLISAAQLVITETEFSREWLAKKYGKSAPKIHRVYNGLDPAAFEIPARSRKTSTIVSIGRCIEKKGFEDLIQACAILKSKGQDFRCTIIGGGPLEEKLRSLAADKNLSDRVTLTGALPQEEVRAFLSEAGIFALACVSESDGGMDNFPTVIVEAMAAGLPVVSTRVAGVPEMVVPGGSGLLVEERTPDALAGALESLLRDPSLAQKMGAAGRDLFRKKFSSDVSGSELLKLLDQVVSRSPS